MNTVLYTTFYPAMLPYLEAFWQSVCAQDDTAFDICIGLDGVTQAQVEQPVGNIDAHWFTDDRLDGIGIRNSALQALCETHDAIILVDSDDILYKDRVSSAKVGLAQSSLYGCALGLIDQAGHSLNLSFTTKVPYNWQAFLVSVNVFGFSNTAYRSELLAACLPTPNNVVMMDWLIATRALANGASVYFDSTPRMAYRQYNSNTARVLSPYTPAQIMRSAQLVSAHYQLVLNDLDIEAMQPYVKRHKEIVSFINAMQEASRLERYTDRLNQLQAVFLWWACVAHPELESLWQ